MLERRKIHVNSHWVPNCCASHFPVAVLSLLAHMKTNWPCFPFQHLVAVRSLMRLMPIYLLYFYYVRRSEDGVIPCSLFYDNMNLSTVIEMLQFATLLENTLSSWKWRECKCCQKYPETIHIWYHMEYVLHFKGF